MEDGSDVATELWALRHRAASSLLSYPEGRAALAAARREGRLNAGMHRRALADFEAAHSELLLVGIDERLARQAGDLAEEHALRGYDAVHLAAALVVDAEVTLVTWDAELSRAASRAGCAVAPAL